MKARSNTNRKVDKGMESLRHDYERKLEVCRKRADLMSGLYVNLADAVFVAELDGRIIDVNPAACSVLGYSRKQLLAMHPWNFVTSASRKDILNLIQGMLPGTPITVQRTYCTKKGDQKIMDLHLTRCDLAGRDLIIVSCRDVTEQKRLEDRLRRSEKNLAEGQRLTKTGSWILDFKTGNTDWSVETCRIFGFPDPPPSPHYSEFRARVRLEDRDEVDHGLRESFETGEPRPLKYIFILPDGTRKNIETISQPVRDEAGELKLMGTVMDVTERVKAQEALQQSEDHLRLVIDTIPGLVWSAKPDGYIDYLNKRWIEYTGLTLEKACGWGWREAIHPEDLSGLEAYWRSILAEGKSGETEARLRRFDGKFRWFLFRGFPLHNGSGKLVQWYGTNTDIDDRKRAEEKLRRSEAYLTEAQCLSRTGSFSWKPASGEIIWSAETFRIFGFDQSFKPTLELARQRIHPDDTALFAEKVRRGLREGKNLEYEHRLLMPDGAVRWLRVVARAAKDESGKVEYIGAVMDITEGKEAAEALRASEHLARGQLDALTTTLDRLSQESEPEKFLEHVLRTIAEQLSAHSIGVWEMNKSPGRTAFVANYENALLQLAAAEPESSPKGSLWEREHPVWSQFFLDGKFCVVGRLDTDPPQVRIENGQDNPWHDWQPNAVSYPLLSTMIKRLSASGIVTTLCVPLFVAGNVTGLISIRFKQSRTFRQEEIELTRALSHQAMLAIQLMRLSQQSREAAVMSERNRIARDIHDTLAQGFTGVIVQLEAAEDANSKGLMKEAQAHLGRAGDLARESLSEARRSVRALRPLALEVKNLCEALEELVRKMTSGTPVRAEFMARGKPRPLPAEWEENLLRIGQEVLTNALRHARATKFNTRFSFRPKEIRMELRDNGMGFDLRQKHDGFGLLGIKERVEAMGGQLTIESAAGKGTTILIVLPDVKTAKSQS